MSAVELDERERDAFLQWRRALAVREEALNEENDRLRAGRSGMVGFEREAADAREKAVTPFEKNLQARLVSSSTSVVLRARPTGAAVPLTQPM